MFVVGALKVNTGVKELHMADNNFDIQDAIQLGSLFRVNNNLQLLDISNNKVKDEGVKHILEGVVTQSENDGPPKGLKILVLWNNHLTKNSANYFSHAFVSLLLLIILLFIFININIYFRKNQKLLRQLILVKIL